MSAEEKAPLMEKNESKNFYFLNNENKNGAVESKESHAENENGNEVQNSRNSSSWLGSFFGSANHRGEPAGKMRKVPVKVEPKVYFANERTFLAWLHMSVTLASISMAILAFAEANAWSQIYGICLMPVAIAFCVYSLWMFIKRAGMIRRKEPGPYEDRAGPIALASMLAVAILVNFTVKLYDYANA